MQKNMMCGGFTNDKVPDNEINQMVLGFKNQVESMAHKTYYTFQAVKYQSQVVAGTNYIIKVLADNTYIHIKIFKPLPYTNQPPTLSNVDFNKNENDPL